jgi:hypothetical protein
MRSAWRREPPRTRAVLADIGGPPLETCINFERVSEAEDLPDFQDPGAAGESDALGVETGRLHLEDLEAMSLRISEFPGVKCWR